MPLAISARVLPLSLGKLCSTVEAPKTWYLSATSHPQESHRPRARSSISSPSARVRRAVTEDPTRRCSGALSPAPCRDCRRECPDASSVRHLCGGHALLPGSYFARSPAKCSDPARPGGFDAVVVLTARSAGERSVAATWLARHLECVSGLQLRSHIADRAWRTRSWVELAVVE